MTQVEEDKLRAMVLKAQVEKTIQGKDFDFQLAQAREQISNLEFQIFNLKTENLKTEMSCRANVDKCKEQEQGLLAQIKILTQQVVNSRVQTKRLEQQIAQQVEVARAASEITQTLQTSLQESQNNYFKLRAVVARFANQANWTVSKYDKKITTCKIPNPWLLAAEALTK